MGSLRKSAMITDIHFGRKSNSDQHNQDCIDFLSWFCESVKQDPTIDCVVFMGDWHENRSALNLSTLKYSFKGAKMLNELGLPIFFIVGNHDLYFRTSRDVYSTVHFSLFHNFHVIDEITECDDFIQPVLMCPYLFHEEYPTLAQYINTPVWFGHFEFQGFVMSGCNHVLPTGPNANDFIGPNRIFSGHFHKRQTNNHVTFIGNVFPMDFGDAGDIDRGYATYEFSSNHTDFVNWDACPKYVHATLSGLLAIPEDKRSALFGSRIKCIADVVLSYEEISAARQSLVEQFQLRELVIEDSAEISDALESSEIDLDEQLMNVNDMMIQLLSGIDTEHIDNELLISIYRSLQPK